MQLSPVLLPVGATLSAEMIVSVVSTPVAATVTVVSSRGLPLYCCLPHCVNCMLREFAWGTAEGHLRRQRHRLTLTRK